VYQPDEFITLAGGARPDFAVDGESVRGRRPRHILFISAKSGGGHDGTAHALAHLLQAAPGADITWQCLDIYEGRLRTLPWLARVRQYGTWLWSLFLKITAWPWVLRLFRWALAERMTRSVIDRVEQAPDVVIATHFAAAQILTNVAARLAPRPSTVIVATDYLPHRSWLASADLMLVSREPGLALARAICPPTQKIVPLTLLPCKPAMPRRAPISRQGRLRLLAVMGADGTSGRRLVRLLRAIARCDWSQLVEVEVICGHNEKLRETIADLGQAGTPAGQGVTGDRAEGLRVHAAGFVTDLPQRLADADICLLRASPLVMTEAIAAATPAIAFDWHAHEAANAQLLESWGCGRSTRSTRELAAVLRDWVLDDALLTRVRERARQLAAEALGPRDIYRLLGSIHLPPPTRGRP
jgi:UDP-N-acetylglucosamine:LPS N-acetylglucosamine transferase